MRSIIIIIVAITINSSCDSFHYELQNDDTNSTSNLSPPPQGQSGGEIHTFPVVGVSTIQDSCNAISQMTNDGADIKLNDNCKIYPNGDDCISLFKLTLASRDIHVFDISEINSGKWAIRLIGAQKSRTYFDLHGHDNYAYSIDALEVISDKFSPKRIGVIYGADWSLDESVSSKPIYFDRTINILNDFKSDSIQLRFIRRCKIGMMGFGQLPNLVTQGISEYSISAIELKKIPQ